MKVEHYLDRVKKSEEFKKFNQENQDNYFCAGFFVLDYDMGNHIHHIDFAIPEKNKIASFHLDEGITLQISESANKKIPDKLEKGILTDIDAIKGIVEDSMKEHKVTKKINKIIAVIQDIDGKVIWSLNCILTGLSILKVHLDDESSSVIRFEQANIFDFVKKVNGNLGKKDGGKAKGKKK